MRDTIKVAFSPTMLFAAFVSIIVNVLPMTVQIRSIRCFWQPLYPEITANVRNDSHSLLFVCEEDLAVPNSYLTIRSYLRDNFINIDRLPVIAKPLPSIVCLLNCLS